MRRTTRTAVFASCMALCAAMVFGVGGAPVAAKVQSPAHAQLPPAAVLSVISGDVLMRTAGGDFRGAVDGAVLYLGSTVRTSPEARAVITFFEGSSVELEPASDITIVRATAPSGSTASLAQSFGRGWYVVTHLMTADSRYELRTPAATASVRGIASDVTVDDGLDALTTTLTARRVATTVAAVSAVVLVTPPAATVRVDSATAPVLSVVGAVRVRASGFRDGRVVAQPTGARAKIAEWSRDRVRQIEQEEWDDRDDDEREDNDDDERQDSDHEEREDSD